MAVSTETKAWTLEELWRLPDDGNKYEVLDGELYVTPAPSEVHEDILARLTRILDPYVAKHGLGRVYRPRAVVRVDGSELEPDLFVRAIREHAPTKDWDDAPIPILVVEVLSPTTRRRDLLSKRDFYRRIGVSEYWIVDPERAAVQIVRPEGDDEIVGDSIRWKPLHGVDPLTVPVSAVLREERSCEERSEYCP